jgi:hypothetical protein
MPDRWMLVKCIFTLQEYSWSEDVRLVGAPYECGLSLLSRSILSRRM